MLSDVSANFSILWISECIPYKCHVQVQESSEPSSLFLESQPVSASPRLTLLPQPSCSHEASGEHVRTKTRIQCISGEAETMHITNSYVMLMLLILEMYSAKHTRGPLSPCSKAPCGSQEGSERARQLSTLQRRSLQEQPTCSSPPFVISVVPDAATATSCSETAGEFFQALFNSLALI